MNLFQLCKLNQKKGRVKDDISLSVLMVSIGREVLAHLSYQPDFVECRQGYSFESLYAFACQNHEAALTGQRFDLSGSERIDYKISYAPDYGFGDTSAPVHLTDGTQIAQNSYAHSMLESYQLHMGRQAGYYWEHGMRAGLWLFDSLGGRYCDEYEKSGRQRAHSFLDFEREGEPQMHYRYAQWNVYRYLAESLFLHDRASEYVKEKQEKVSLREDPVLFLLIFSEWFAPHDLFRSENSLSKDVLKKISLEWEEDELLVIFGREEGLFKVYFDRRQRLYSILKLQIQAERDALRLRIRFGN